MTTSVRRLWVAATDLELACAPCATGRKMEGPWRWSRHDADATLATGAGPVAAAAGLSWFLALHPVQEIVGIGIAGSLVGAPFGVGAVCRIGSDRFDGLGAEAGDGGPLELPFPGLENGPWHLAAPPDLARLPTARGLTVATATGTARTALRRRRLGADLESMEGAAWARTAARFSTPFAQVRAVSNLASFRSPPSWDVASALRALQSALLPQEAPA
jgi:futalosine hydrolase